MDVILEGIILPELEFVERFTRTGVTAKIERTLAGVPIVWEQKEYGFPITLKGGNHSGIMTINILRQITALASVPGAIYALQYDTDFYNVRFRHEEGAISADYVGHHLSPYYKNVIIKLQEV